MTPNSGRGTSFHFTLPSEVETLEIIMQRAFGSSPHKRWRISASRHDWRLSCTTCWLESLARSRIAIRSRRGSFRSLSLLVQAEFRSSLRGTCHFRRSSWVFSQLRTAMAWQRVKSVDEIKPSFLRDSPGFHLIPEVYPAPQRGGEVLDWPDRYQGGVR